MQRRSQADGANRIWVADLTYGPTRAEFVYLAVVLDVWSRPVVGWSMSERLKATQSCDALGDGVSAPGVSAPRTRGGFVAHSDRGV